MLCIIFSVAEQSRDEVAIQHVKAVKLVTTHPVICGELCIK